MESKCGSGNHDVHYYSKPLAVDNGGKYSSRIFSNCVDCRDEYAFISAEELKRRQKKRRIESKYNLLLAKSRFNKTYINTFVPVPDGRKGGTTLKRGTELNGELAFFIIGSDDMWRVIAEFL